MQGVGETLLGDVSVFVDSYHRMERRCSELEASMYNAEKFYAVPLGIDVVAKLHSVSPYLVRTYVSLGMIPLHPQSTDAKMVIRASDALVLDFNKMREQSKAKR